ncbi:nucleotidyl transferase AbiEii/AbiGii toxin family protein [Streptomyces sp. NPDC091292]|uniref:nucleotidyl transferase AbiEii/AbiGii toxin family protein n=1 Tax=Streptomyces sp. NPDC091292 TaxID=3365991 RepID=UPI00382C99AB
MRHGAGDGERPVTGGWARLGWTSTRVPDEPLDEATRRSLDLPRTLRPSPGEGVVRRPVFDPALKQYANAYRAADPVFPDPERDAAWHAARRTALDLVLAAVADSAWVESLVLRGSVLLSAWYGDAAREPGDLDFVVVPARWKIGDERTGRMLDGITEAAERVAAERGGEVRLSARGAVSEDIWTYERVPGRRLLIPWSAPGLPGGDVQLDFVFNEKLPVEPQPAEVAPGTVVWAATPELSLAWKILWLVSDMHGQGKDLYDAVLLAEHHPLRHSLLHEVFRLTDEWPHPDRDEIRASDVEEALRYVEWHHFATEYPRFAGEERDFVGRLVRALRPTFEEAP